MDILNIISWIKGKRVVKTVDPAKTLIPVALKDDRRDDGYLACVMSVEDFANDIKADCGLTNTYRAGIYNIYPFPIEPTMIKTCTSIIDTPPSPTVLAVNLQGYKVGGTVEVFGNQSYGVYMGSIEIPDTGQDIFIQWSITGAVTAYDNLGPDTVPVTSPLGLFNNVIDSDSGGVTYGQISFVTFPYTNPGVFGYDLVMFVDPTSFEPIVGNIEATVSFEYEFLIDATLTPSFIIYD